LLYKVAAKYPSDSEIAFQAEIERALDVVAPGPLMVSYSSLIAAFDICKHKFVDSLHLAIMMRCKIFPNKEFHDGITADFFHPCSGLSTKYTASG
jgi:hypothetical protein